MSSTKSYYECQALFYKKVLSHMDRAKRNVEEFENRKKRVSKEWFYGKRSGGKKCQNKN